MIKISRDDWGASEPRHAYSKHIPRFVGIHHSASDQDAYNGAPSIRTFQRYHQHHRGWNDIGYHYIIGPDGKVYEGRPEDAMGAHVKGKNDGSIGICLIGDYRPGRDQLTRFGWSALVGVCCEVMKRWNIPPDQLYGHRDLGYTQCPGDQLYYPIAVIRFIYGVEL